MCFNRIFGFVIGLVIIQIIFVAYKVVSTDIAANKLADKMNCLNLGSITETSKIKLFECNGELKLVKVQ